MTDNPVSFSDAYIPDATRHKPGIISIISNVLRANFVRKRVEVVAAVHGRVSHKNAVMTGLAALFSFPWKKKEKGLLKKRARVCVYIYQVIFSI